MPRSREIRLGIVMYGGVSLAIYIYGVAHEFFRAVRGQGIYKLLKVLTDSDIVVDVISGTSAGGINGILLSYALCNELQFSSVSSLWRLHGDIRQLLRSPYGAIADTTSLLDSEGYYQPKLEAAFSQMEGGRRSGKPYQLAKILRGGMRFTRSKSRAQKLRSRGHFWTP